MDADVQRLSIAVDTLELNLQRKSEQLIQQKLEHETEAAHLTRAASEARTLGEHARHQDVILQRNERRIEESKREAASVTETLKELQKDLVHRQARLDDALRNAANLWSAIARLGRKFDEYERIATVQATRPVHDKYEDACSFLRYIRGWWSMYKDKDPSALKLEYVSWLLFFVTCQFSTPHFLTQRITFATQACCRGVTGAVRPCSPGGLHSCVSCTLLRCFAHCKRGLHNDSGLLVCAGRVCSLSVTPFTCTFLFLALCSWRSFYYLLPAATPPV